MKFPRKVFKDAQFVVLILAVFACLLFAVKLVEPFVPLITIVVVIVLTLCTFEKWLTLILSVVGVALFAASWPVTEAWGTWPGVIVYGLGILAWWAGVKEWFSRN